jgi:hypothetical protein
MLTSVNKLIKYYEPVMLFPYGDASFRGQQEKLDRNQHNVIHIHTNVLWD